MNRAGDYIFSIDDSVPGRATGWCFNERNFQPVELRCSCSGTQIFTITACSKVFIDELDEERNAGFEINVDRTAWRLTNQIDILTPEGHLLGTIVQNRVLIVKSDDDLAEDDVDTRMLKSHFLVYSTPQRISGQVLLEGSDFHYAKLFSDGVLRGYAPMERLNGEGDAEDDGEQLVKHGYLFEQDRQAPLLPTLVFIVVDDKFAFAASSQRALMLENDPSIRILPLHFELDQVCATATRCDVGANGVGLYSARHYLGSGTRALLVYQKSVPFEMTIDLVDGARIEARHSGDLLVLEQVKSA